MRTTIGEICVPTESFDPSRRPDTTFQYVDISAVDNQRKKIVAARTVIGKDAPSRARNLIREGDVIVATTRPNLNAVALVPPELDGEICSTGFCVLRPSARVDFQYLFFTAQTPEFVESLSELARGANYPAVSDKQILKQSVLVPDLAIQRRIASRLKQQMAAVEQARQQVLDQIRQAEILRLKYFRDAFDESALAAWDARSLLDIARIVSGMTLGGPVAKGPTTKVPYLRVANVKDGFLMLDDVKEIDATERDIESFQLQNGDVVLTEGGDPDKLGRGTVWREEIALCLHQNHIFRVRFDQEQVCPEFAAYQFASLYGKAYFLAHAKQTTGIASINKGVLSRFPFRLPPLATQRRIAARLRGQFEQLQQLKSVLSDQLAALDQLPGAYLREAFGNLE